MTPPPTPHGFNMSRFQTLNKTVVKDHRRTTTRLKTLFDRRMRNIVLFFYQIYIEIGFESRCPTYVGKSSVKCSFKICLAPIHFASCPRSPWNSLKSRVQPLVTVSTNQILPGLWCWRRITMIPPPPHFIAWNRLESGPAPADSSKPSVIRRGLLGWRGFREHELFPASLLQ